MRFKIFMEDWVYMTKDIHIIQINIPGQIGIACELDV